MLGGPITMTSDHVTSNEAAGGNGGPAPLSGLLVGGRGGFGGAGSGGGLYVASGTVTVAGGALNNNKAIGGDGAAGSRDDPTPSFGMGIGPGSAGRGGSASGGGLYVAAGTVTLNGALFTGNEADGGTGASKSYYGGFHGGGTGFGGGVYMAGGTLSLHTDTFNNNKAEGGNAPSRIELGGYGAVGGKGAGGGLYLVDGSVSLLNDIFSGNQATGGVGSAGDGNGTGGGLYVVGGNVTLSNGTLSANSAKGYAASGGGLYVGFGVTVVGTGTSISGDSVTAYPGGTASYADVAANGTGLGYWLKGLTYQSVVNTPEELIADVVIADNNSGSYTLTLAPGITFDFIAALDLTDGGDALPVVTGSVTVIGNGDTIERTGSDAFRLFDVAAGGSLTLEDLTLTGGLVTGNGSAGEGGAIYSAGKLTLGGVTVSNNKAVGPNASGGGLCVAGGSAELTSDNFSNNEAVGGNAYGGGLCVTGGVVILNGDTLNLNQASGGEGDSADSIGSAVLAGTGGVGSGGGLYVAGGAVTMNDDTISNNRAQGGNGGINRDFGDPVPLSGGAGGVGFGGGVAVAGGTVASSNDAISNNDAHGGSGGNGESPYNEVVGGVGGAGSGGGLEVEAGTLSFNNDAITKNEAKGGEGGNGINNGAGGAGGVGSGGGLSVAGGMVTLANETLGTNAANGGTGGIGGNENVYYSNGGNGGNGGNGTGGGLYVSSGVTVLGDSTTTIANDTVAAGTGGAPGTGTISGSNGSAGSTSFADLAANSTGLGNFSVDVITSTVAPLPANETPAFVVNWNGTDAAGLSLTYNVFVSKNGGTFQPWVTNTAASSAVFTGSIGAKYSFYSVATNSFGLSQPNPTSAEAITTIVQNPTSSLSKSTVQVAKEVTAGETTTVTLHVVLANGSPATSGGLTVKFALGSTAGGHGTFSVVSDNGNGTYSAVLTGMQAGSNTIVATINSKRLTSKAPSIAVTDGALDLALSTVKLSATTVRAGGDATITFQPEDAAGNRLLLGTALLPVFSLASGGGTFEHYSYNNKTGAYSAIVTTTVAGTDTIATHYNSQSVTSKAPTVTVTPGPLSYTDSSVIVSVSSVQVGTSVAITFQAVDAYGNAETEKLAVAFALEAGSGKGKFGTATDLGNGEYQAEFTPTTAATDIIEALVRGYKVKSTATLKVTTG